MPRSHPCRGVPVNSSANGPTTRSGTASSAGRSRSVGSRRTRDRVAGLINAHRDEIAFINSTTQGIGLIAEGYPWQTGDNVVTVNEEYPSNLLPWMNLESRGVEVRQVASRECRVWIDDLIAAFDRSTRVLAISHVEFATGFRNDLDALSEICRGRGRPVRRCHPGARAVPHRRAADADRFPRRRRPQVAAGSGGRRGSSS